MECCDIKSVVDIDQDKTQLVIAGNPNVGKSIFFNYFTDTYVDISNYPGTTLEINSGKYHDMIVHDTPGVYGVSSFNDEERVARDVIISADMVINVVDALHLDRDLFLTQQMIDMDKPVIVALNMMDEAREKGLNIDVEKLSRELGVPVVPTVAINQTGFEELEKNLEKAKTGSTCLPENFTEQLNDLNTKTENIGESLLLIEGDEDIKDKYDLEVEEARDEIYRIRREKIDQIVNQVTQRESAETGFKDKLGEWLLRPLTGIPILLLILFAMYEFVGVFIAQTVVEFTEGKIFADIYEPFIRDTVGQILAPGSFISNLLVGEFGVLTMTVTYTFGLLLPLVFGFYLFLSLLEDSGFLPRIAALTDRVLSAVGLNGRAIIPMILGFGCVTMATITTRLLGSKRERIIAILLLGLTIPCSAQLGVIIGLIAPLGMEFFLIYFLTILAVYIISGTILNKILPGKSTDLLIDLPPIRLPGLKNIFKKSGIKSKMFIKEAGPIFVIGSGVVTVMKSTNFLEMLQQWLAPLVESWLQLPAEVSTAFVMGIIRRDFGAAGLTDITMSPIQTTIALITITLFVPCIASMFIMIKERNWKEAAGIWVGSWITAFLVSGIVAQLF